MTKWVDLKNIFHVLAAALRFLDFCIVSKGFSQRKNAIKSTIITHGKSKIKQKIGVEISSTAIRQYCTSK